MGIAILLAPQAVCANDALQTPQKEENPTIEFADTLSLEEITVKANFSPANRTALRLKTITAEEIRLQSAARTYPEMLKAYRGSMPPPNPAVMEMQSLTSADLGRRISL